MSASSAHAVQTAVESVWQYVLVRHERYDSPHPPSARCLDSRKALQAARARWSRPVGSPPCTSASTPNQQPYVKHTAQLPYQLPSSRCWSRTYCTPRAIARVTSLQTVGGCGMRGARCSAAKQRATGGRRGNRDPAPPCPSHALGLVAGKVALEGDEAGDGRGRELRVRVVDHDVAKDLRGVQELIPVELSSSSTPTTSKQARAVAHRVRAVVAAHQGPPRISSYVAQPPSGFWKANRTSTAS